MRPTAGCPVSQGDWLGEPGLVTNGTVVPFSLLGIFRSRTERVSPWPTIASTGRQAVKKKGATRHACSSPRRPNPAKIPLPPARPGFTLLIYHPVP
jgi:hypothetical protein